MVSVENIKEQYRKLHDLCYMDKIGEVFIGYLKENIYHIIESLDKDKSVVLRPYCETSRYIIDLMAGNTQNIKVCDLCESAEKYKGIAIEAYDKCLDRKADYCFINVSYKYRKEILEEFKRDKVKYIDLYQELVKLGMKLNTILSQYKIDSHAIPNFFWNKYKQEKNSSNLKNLMASLIENYDFYGLEKLLKENQGLYDAEIEENYIKLKRMIKQAVNERKKNDIIMFWIDAVPYKWRKLLPFVNGLSKDSLSFENVYTVAPYTHQTFKAMFDRQKPLDHYKKSVELLGCDNCELINYLETKGYMFKQIGHDGVINFSCKDEYLDNRDKDVTCNKVYWEALLSMINSEKPCFFILHTVVETHPPMLCSELDNFNIYVDQDTYCQQAKTSYEYIDNRINYYQEFFNEVTQIFMSDHGEHVSNPYDKFWFQDKVHAWMEIKGKGIYKRKEKRLFSYLQFTDLVKWILRDNQDYESLFTPIIEIQDVDFFNKDIVLHLIKTRNQAKYLAYKAYFDGKYKYAINRANEKFYYKVIEDKDIEIKRSEAELNFELLEGCVDDKFPAIWECEKFQHCKELYDSYMDNVKV